MAYTLLMLNFLDQFDQFLDSTEVLPILEMLECCFHLGIRQFCTKCLFVIITVPNFSVSKIIYWVGNGQFKFTGWAK